MPNKQITIAGAATLLKGRSFYTYSKTFAFTNNAAAIALADIEKYSAQDALNVKAGDLVLDTAGQVAIVSAVNDTIAVVKSAVNLKGAKGDKGNDGKGVKTIAKTSTSGLVDTYTITYTDNSTATYTVKNGAAGVAAGVGTPTVDNSTANTVGTAAVEVSTSGPNTAKVFNFKFKNLKGQKGDTGDPFRIDKVFTSLTAMKADTTVAVGRYVMVQGDSTTEDYGKVYLRIKAGAVTDASKLAETWTFIVDMSVAVKGPKGDPGTPGTNGAAAGFGTPTATVGTDDPSKAATVSVAASGSNTSKVFAFTFNNIKGATGVRGPQGYKITGAKFVGNDLVFDTDEPMN